ncbi:cupin domain-containing protein [Streptomyces sp. H27-H1]|uniref:cupin domain-containing protein n=1 Tax=Streptomyces sp. H27-H1 TaxID=2996461 RepID=UPI0022711882|nr:cupin domain-containing protein [Streptomyces sp. H27-H1]MCY0925741.1 cupin domain-containing protein [Streptomyces sp. H27-H1]
MTTPSTQENTYENSRTAPGTGTAGVVNIAEKLAGFTEQWAPHRIARVNDYEVKIAKIQGEFIWHTHEDTDELFLVVSGTLTIRLHAGDVVLNPGEIYVVPRGVEHCPQADGETAILMFEPAGTANTGGEVSDRTREPVEA